MGLATGNTPLVRFTHLAGGLPGSVAGKIEYRNPARSAGCRVAAAMVADATAAGTLKPGMTVVEATTGNTGIALAQACARMGHKFIATMPDCMSLERRKVMKALGAQVILTPSNDGMQGAVDRARAIAVCDKNCFFADQYSNPSNPAMHYRTTAPEIWRDAGEKLGAVVAGIGTGGTISGIGRFFKEQAALVRVIGVEPESCCVLTGGKYGPTRIQGLGAGFAPKTLDMSVVDEIICVSDDEAFEWTRRLASREGLFCGISSGAAAAAAVTVAARPEYKDTMVVCILPDSGELYLSTALFQV
jgi:cysteine synthase